MAVSKTQIANLALSHLDSEDVIENIDTEQSTEAKVARLWYDPARRQALAEYDFHFSRKRLILATHNEDPPSDWAFRYQFPADAVQERFIENPAGRTKPPIPMIVEQAVDGTRSILTDQDEACLVYSRDEEDVTFFPPHFDLALSYLLAHYMSGKIAGKASYKERTIQAYNIAAATGASVQANASAKTTEAPPLASWHLER